jgi:hypothetical protein
MEAAMKQSVPEFYGPCDICGCNDFNACVRECSNGMLRCSWAAPGLCSFCYWKQAEEMYRQAVGEREQRRIEVLA